MIDIKSLLDEIEKMKEKLIDRETRLKAMEIAYFEMVVDRDWHKQKLESLEAKA